MVIKINQDLCAGCGICINECPSGAIYTTNGYAVIDQKLCTKCETCLDNCPIGAVEITDDQPEREIIQAGKAAQPVQSLQGQVIYPIPASRIYKLAPLANAVLAYMGREVMPRVIDVVVSALENRVSRTAEHEKISLSPGLHPETNRERGSGRQIRYRGGRGNFGNRKGRR